MNLTPGQRAAVEHRGSNLLVAASAGSGKTEALARRCVDLVRDPHRPCGVEQLLVVTFTRAAAAELRARIGRMLREAAARESDDGRRERLRREAVLVDVAEISTIDGWCNRLVREHALELSVDPAFSVLGEEDSKILRRDALDELMEWIYRSDDAVAAAGRDWIARNSSPSDGYLRAHVAALSRFREHLVNPQAWFERQRVRCAAPAEVLRADEARQIAEAVRGECEFQLQQLRSAPAGRSAALAEFVARYADSLASWARRLREPEALPEVLTEIAAARFRKPSMLPDADADLLEEIRDGWFSKRLKKPWNATDVAGQVECAPETARLVSTLLALEDRYRQKLERAKRVRAAYEFGDVLRMALDLLGRPGAGERREPGAVALALRRRYEHVLVDEYQDTSPVQVELLRLVARQPPEASNCFLVGDVKQSIYGFREAEPRLFSALVDELRSGGAGGRVAYLSDNFRSRPALVDAFNGLFSRLFTREFGGTPFDAREQLVATRPPAGVSEPPIDVWILTDDQAGQEESDDAGNHDGEMPLERIEDEARLLADQIARLLDDRTPIAEKSPHGSERERPIRLSDIVVLLRAAEGNAGLVAHVLRQHDIPAVTGGRDSLLDALEVLDVRNVLTLLVNRRDDVALAAYLRGPMARLSERELLAIRRCSPARCFADAAQVAADCLMDERSRAKLAGALQQLRRWSNRALETELPALVRQICAETALATFALGLPGGEHRVAALHAFQTLARDFSSSGGRGLAEFVAYLDDLEQEDVAPAAPIASADDAVRIMTIHAAKGLEFPVVFVLNAGAKFRCKQGTPGLLCDERFGIGLEFLDYRARKRLTSAPREIIRDDRRTREMEEELRLLYVAATRARERLFIVGHGRSDDLERARRSVGNSRTPPRILRQNAGCFLDWVNLAVAAGALDQAASPTAPPLVRVRTVATYRAAGPTAPPQVTPDSAGAGARDSGPGPTGSDAGSAGRWLERARFLLSTQLDTRLAGIPAAVSVSTLKQFAYRADEADESHAHRAARTALSSPRFAAASDDSDGLAVGSAVHRFLQHADLSALATRAGIRDEIERLCAAARLTRREAARVPIDAVFWFGGTAEGRLLADPPGPVRRELPFVYALPLSPESEFAVLRGVIDCLIDAPDGLIILDYKTDRLRAGAELDERIRAYSIQMQAYAHAAAAILDKAVCRRVLVFLAARRVVEVPPAAPQIAALCAGFGAHDLGVQSVAGPDPAP
jgi:ATP-dependent helicase/nuclease subunit A